LEQYFVYIFGCGVNINGFQIARDNGVDVKEAKGQTNEKRGQGNVFEKGHGFIYYTTFKKSSVKMAADPLGRQRLTLFFE
jgi:hypothetical protein